MDRFNKAMVLAILFLSATVAWQGYVAAFSAPSRSTIISPGLTMNCDLIAYKDGSTYMTWKGAGGDNLDAGSASASTEYQAALNAGGSLCFTTGTYDFAAGQSLPAGMNVGPATATPVGKAGLILPANQAIYCTTGAILTTTTAISGTNDFFAMFVNKDVTTNDGNILIDGCQISLPAPTTTGSAMTAWDDAIVMQGVHDSTFRDLLITQGDIELYPNTGSINTATVLKTGFNYNNLIEGVTENKQTGNTVLFQATNSTIAYSTINQLWDDGFLIASAGLNNKIIGNTVNGQAASNGKGSLTAGIYIQNDGAVCAHDKTSCLSDNIVIGNTVYNVTQHATIRPEDGVHVLYGQNTIISQNNIHGNTGWGIQVENSNNTLISYNIIHDTASDGIKIVVSTASSYQETTMNGNIIFNNGVNGVGNAGIQLASGVSTYTMKNINIIGNTFYDDFQVGACGATCHQQYAIRLATVGPVIGLLVTGNNVLRSPTGGNAPFNLAAGGTLTSVFINNNPGQNPVGAITNFVENTGHTANWLIGTTTPSSATVYTIAWTPMQLIILAGTVTAIIVNGKTIASVATTEVLELAVGDTFSVTFSVAPTWQATFR